MAAGGEQVLVVWHACPIVDRRGTVAACSIGGQRIAVQNGSLRAVGANVAESRGAPDGTFTVYPSVVMNAGGRSGVMWVDTSMGPAGEVFGELFDASGAHPGANFKVNTGQGYIYTRPEVALLKEGQFMVVWDDSSAADSCLGGRRFTAGPTPQGPPAVFAADEGLQTGQPALAGAGRATSSRG